MRGEEQTTVTPLSVMPNRQTDTDTDTDTHTHTHTHRHRHTHTDTHRHTHTHTHKVYNHKQTNNKLLGSIIAVMDGEWLGRSAGAGGMRARRRPHLVLVWFKGAEAWRCARNAGRNGGGGGKHVSHSLLVSHRKKEEFKVRQHINQPKQRPIATAIASPSKHQTGPAYLQADSRGEGAVHLCGNAAPILLSAVRAQCSGVIARLPLPPQT